MLIATLFTIAKRQEQPAKKFGRTVLNISQKQTPVRFGILVYSQHAGVSKLYFLPKKVFHMMLIPSAHTEIRTSSKLVIFLFQTSKSHN